VDALLDDDDDVIVVDHLSDRHRDNLAGAVRRGAELVRGDVSDVATMRDVFVDARPDVVFHMAAQIDVRRSVADPSIDAHVNVGGTAAVLEAARRAGALRVLLASTASVYGDPRAVWTPEDAPLAPLSPYGASKAAAETYMSLFRRLHGISTLSLRMSNVYGPRQDPHGDSGVVAIFSAAAREDRVATVYGDGRQTRDYLYVGDAARAFLAAAYSDTEGVLNISTGVETTLLELAQMLGVRAAFTRGRAGEITRSCLDPRHAERLLGWRAATPLAEGLRETVSHAGCPAGGTFVARPTGARSGLPSPAAAVSTRPSATCASHQRR
jgi:UDP-glucose 4-epimerase